MENFATAEEGQVRKAFAKWVEELKVQRDAEKKDKKKKKKWKLIDLEPLVATVTLTVSFLSFLSHPFFLPSFFTFFKLLF